MKNFDVNLKKMILNSEIVSFDVYDTLVNRNLSKPTDIFDIISIKYESQLNNFKKMRIIAEKKCRDYNNGKEITLDEIYNKLNTIYKMDLSDIKQYEIELEKKVATRNDEMFEVYKYCLEKGKKIIITSDMYLDLSTIQSILLKCGYNRYDKLYLSSELKVRKKNGLIYDKIIEDYKIEPIKILHIGDNLQSDINQANNKNLSTYYYSKLKDEIKLFELCKENIILNGFLNNHKKDEYYEKLGYNVLGPLLYGFCKWLNQNEIKYNPDKIIFLSRDGAIMKRAYEKLYGVDEKYIYAYASRRSLIVPTLWKDCSVDFIQNSIHFHKSMYLSEVLERIGLEIGEIKNEVKQLNLNEKAIIDGTNLKNDNNFKQLFPLIKSKIYNNSKLEFTIAKKYWLKIIGTSKKVFIIDIGWNGNMQNAINNLLDYSKIDDVDVKGFYLGVNPDTKYHFDMNGFIYDKNKNNNLKNILEPFSGLFESFFMTNHGSVKRYVKDGNKVELYENEYQSKNGMIVNEIKCLDKIQESALLFIENFNVYESSIDIKIEDKCYYDNIINLGLHPSVESATNLGNFRFFNSGYTYLARKSSSKNSIKDFSKSNWKIGYLKRYLKVNLRYDKIVSVLKKVRNIWR